MSGFGFAVHSRLPGRLGRTGVITTPHGPIRTPAFVAVGTKATVKAVLPESMADLAPRHCWPTPTTCICSPAPTSSTQPVGWRRS